MKRFTCFLFILTALLTCFSMPFAACTNNSAVPSHEYLVVANTDGGLKITGFNPQTLPEDVVIPEKIGGKAVVEIGRLAFSECETITSVYIPDSVKEIGKNAFYHCKKLKKVTLPEGLERISEYCFSACRSLSSINLPDSVETIGEYSFSGTKIGAIKMPASLKTIKEYAFLYCLRLQTSIPDGVTVEESAFSTQSSVSYPLTVNSYTFTDKTTLSKTSFGEASFYVSFASDSPDSLPTKFFNGKHFWCEQIDGYFSSFFYGCEMGYDDNFPYVQSVTLDKITINGKIDYSISAVGTQQPPYRHGYKFAGWSMTKDTTTADFTMVLYDKIFNTDDGSVTKEFYGTDKNTDKKTALPLGTTLYAVWQELDENGSVLIPV